MDVGKPPHRTAGLDSPPGIAWSLDRIFGNRRTHVVAASRTKSLEPGSQAGPPPSSCVIVAPSGGVDVKHN